MTIAKKEQIRALLKSIETGDPGPVAVVNEAKYIQHNPQTHEGSEGLVALFQRLSKSSPRVNIVRAFEDGGKISKACTKFVAIFCALLGQSAAIAQDNDGINAIYERMTAAYAALDSKAFVDIYAADAIYLRSDKNSMLDNIDAIAKNYDNYFSGIGEHNGRLQLLFRVIDRKCSLTLCSDVGWYEHTLYDADGNIRDTYYGRFLTTPGQSTDGLWRFLADLDAGATAEHWGAATPKPGWHFSE